MKQELMKPEHKWGQKPLGRGQKPPGLGQGRELDGVTAILMYCVITSMLALLLGQKLSGPICYV